LKIDGDEPVEKKKSNRKTGKKIGKKIAIFVIVLLVFAGIGGVVKHFVGNLNKNETRSKERTITYFKNDEWYVVDDNGKSVQITKDFCGNIKEAEREYYDSGEWIYQYRDIMIYDGGDYYYDSEAQDALLKNSWEDYWNGWSSSHRSDNDIQIIEYRGKRIVIYLDECYVDGVSGTIDGVHKSDVGSYVGSLYCRDLDNLEEEPELIATDVAEYTPSENGYITYKPWYGGDGSIYNLSSLKIMEGTKKQKNEIYADYETSSECSLYVYKDGEDCLIDTNVSSFDDTAFDNGFLYYIKVSGLYRYSLEDSSEQIAEKVLWNSNATEKGELYYTIREDGDENLYCFNGQDSTVIGENVKWKSSVTEKGELYYVAGEEGHKSLYYFNGQDSVALLGNGNFTASEYWNDDEMYCGIVLNDGTVMLAMHDNLNEVKDAYGHDVSSLHIDSDASQLYYHSTKGLMRCDIKDDTLSEAEICVEGDGFSDCDGSSEQWGVIGNKNWFVLRGGASLSLFVDGEKIDDVVHATTVQKIGDALYYYNGEALMKYKGDKKETLSDNVDSVTFGSDKEVYCDKKDVLYCYDMRKKEETKVAESLCSHEVLSAGGCFYLKNYTGTDDYGTDYSSTLEGWKIGTSDICLYKDGEETLIDSQVMKWNYIIY
jgi:hypothetical protein